MGFPWFSMVFPWFSDKMLGQASQVRAAAQVADRRHLVQLLEAVRHGRLTAPGDGRQRF